MHLRIDPIARFMLDHDKALAQLASLGKATRSLEEKGYSTHAHQHVRSALRFIEEEVTIHNKNEEEALFPVLERYVEGPTVLMRKEHTELRREFRLLRKAVVRFEREQNNRRRIKELVSISKTITQLLVNHIHKENYILFPVMQKFLTKDALREIARRMS